MPRTQREDTTQVGYRRCEAWEHEEPTVPYHDDLTWWWRLRRWVANRLWGMARAVAP